jgi:arylsulfatase
MSRQPNILLIVTDEERFTLPRPAGFELPSHERIAARGVSFDRYYAASTMCSSSRSVIYSGQHVPITEVFDNDNMPYVRPLDPALGTIGTMLRGRGYHCAYKGKWHLSNSYLDPANPVSTVDALEPYGFSEWNDWGDIDGGAWAGLKVDPVIAGQAAQWLRMRAPQVGAEQPWLLAVNFVNPHDIMSFDYGTRSNVTLPPGLDHAVKVKPPADVPLYQRRWDVEVPVSAGDDLADAAPAVREYAEVLDVTFGSISDDEAWQRGISFYLNCIRDVDRHIGVVLDALEASGAADDTVIIFTADHGEMAGSHGLRQKANLVYDENFHVPLLISHPELGAGAGSTSGALASAVDLAPTVLAIAGATDEEIATDHPGLRGRSLLPALDGSPVRSGVLTAVESITTLDAGFWRHFDDPETPNKILSGELRPDWDKRGFLRGFTDDRYSFGRYFAALEPNRPGSLDDLYARNDVVLYDRQEDPHELVNLAADPANAELVDTYRGKLEALISAEIGADDEPWVTERPNLLGWPTWRGDGPPPPQA